MPIQFLNFSGISHFASEYLFKPFVLCTHAKHKKHPGFVYLKRLKMNIYFRAKWLQYLFKKNENQGNVLIALLGLMIIVGVLVAMALPSLTSLTSCGGKANQSEGKQYIGAMNRSQQAYHLENGAFVASIPKLGLGIQTKTKNYEYSVRATKTAVFNYAIAQKTPSKPLKSYVGAVFIVPASKVDKKASKNNKETLAILCETDTPTNQIPAEPTYQKGVLACGSNTHSIP
jgi:type II secretory pathway pseudopilin PulG